jgi:hypothetical protein
LIADNLNIDIVLDKISETGMDSLNELEKEFLKIINMIKITKKNEIQPF